MGSDIQEDFLKKLIQEKRNLTTHETHERGAHNRKFTKA